MAFLSDSFYLRRSALLASLVAVTMFAGGCGLVNGIYDSFAGAVGAQESCTVISQRANIRSSYAVVAADVLEVKRGQELKILEEGNFEGVQWYRVRANDEDQTEGWIEAQHVIKEGLLDKSKQLAEEDKQLQPQATGQLRASSNLRLSPEVKDDNILLLMDSGSTFDIVDWVYVKKTPDEDAEEQNEEIAAAGREGDPEKLDDNYDMWYKIRLDPSVSPAPMGWVYGRQVELQVPSDIVYYQSNDRKFVTWMRIDDVPVENPSSGQKDTAAKVYKPGSWVILSRTNEVKGFDGVEPDFDGILVLGFDKYNEEHYTVYSTRRERFDVWGLLPVRMEGSGDNKTFTVKLRNRESGEMLDKKFTVYRDKNRRLRVTPPEDLDSFGYREKRR